ncbi:hypothetical protein DESUT3_21900 [Desulfuromonas versatilis]|uniref:Response regulatory domain-containing protein n=1 Tax=Desulfuromonas versatilis TaxID=2802975 RepID=A0ABM8HX26_9BACT|nr:zinc-ribbon domain-containing protein [Desulfuromonas versatilis]BCR05121.1 hypothetical protein DESUT3_21900 [Desulfuromonas versatilis]
MVIECPFCSTRFSFDQRRLDGKRVKIRCAKCGGVFSQEIRAEQYPHNQLRTLVAHGDRTLCLAIGDLLTRGGIGWQACQNGMRVLPSLKSWTPEVLLIDVALPGVPGFRLVEQVRNDSYLENTKVILISSSYNRKAYKRPPGDLYGADACIEVHRLESDLVPLISELTGRLRHKTGSEEQRDPGQSGIAEPAATPGKPPGGDSAPAADREKARQLAEMIAADIVLFHQDLVDEGVRSGRVYDLLADPIAEGHRTFARRLPGISGGEVYLRLALEKMIARRGNELFQAKQQK